MDSAVRVIGSERCVTVQGADSEAAPAPVDCKPNWWRQMADTARYLFVPSETFSFACYLFSCTLVRYSDVTEMKHESIKPLSFNSNRNIQRTYLLFLLIAISMYNSQETPPDSQ